MKKILIIDDEPEICDLVTNRLETNGYEVISALDASLGMDRAKNENPDLIVMDIMMPDMSGGDAVRLLQKDEDVQNIPVIFLTAVLAKKEESFGQHINIDGEFYPAIAKPFNPDEFLAKVQEVLSE